jgi:cytochrome c peroxidase
VANIMDRRILIKLSIVCLAVLSALILFRCTAKKDGTRLVQQGNPPSYSPYPAGVIPGDLELEIQRVELEVDQVEHQALAQWRALPINAGTRAKQIQILGKLLLFDKSLSVNKNQACSFCHTPETAFTGPISSINATTVAYPGSVHYRFGHRKPQSYTYATYYPPLHYNETQQDFYGGNFWDMRATGHKLQNSAAEQATDPPLDPQEMGLPDSACVVYRLSQSEYRPLFETVWGPQAFAINWPGNVEQVCNTPGPPPQNDPLPVHLNPEDRNRSNTTYDQFGLSISAYEAVPEVSPFTSKFDYAVAHTDKQVLTADEQAGWELFHSKANCNTCHLDGTENPGTKGLGKITTGNAASVAPLFTDFTSTNIGVPRNPALAYYYEDKPDPFGFTPNPLGFKFIDLGVGGFLRGPTSCFPPGSSCNPNSDWASLADQFDGKMQVPSLRNVDKRPSPDFVKAYMHNGYFKSLKEVVHFYNTRDALKRCDGPNSTGEKVTCWPAPEVAQNVNKTIGNLGLTDKEEDQLVAFMQALTDGYKP